jgi:Leucine-rich repeat (LRR) protein
MKEMASLSRLALRNTELHSLNKLSTASRLKSLNLSGSRAIVDFSELAGCSHLTDLILASTSFADSDTVHLASLLSLERLNIANTRVSTIRPFSRIPNLKRLVITGLNIPKSEIDEFESIKPKSLFL